MSVLRRLFLPRGTLPPDYLRFQLLDSAQGLCSYLRGVLTMHATFTGLGVGSADSSALAATLVALLKEGSSHVASLLFAYGYAARLDAEVRWWRLFADVANDVGLTLELAAPLCGRYFLAISCTANACKALCGVAAGATRVAVSAHFAGGSHSGAHVAEVAAKEGTQETAVTLLGLVLGMALAPTLNANVRVQWAAFIMLTAVHVVANAAAVRALALRTLSRTRALMLLDEATRSGTLPLSTPQVLRLEEPLVPVQFIGTAAAFARLCCSSRGHISGGGGGGGNATSNMDSEGISLRLGCSVAHLQRVAMLGRGGGDEVPLHTWTRHVLCIRCDPDKPPTASLLDVILSRRPHEHVGALEGTPPLLKRSKGRRASAVSLAAPLPPSPPPAVGEEGGGEGEEYFLLAAHSSGSGSITVAVAFPLGASARTHLLGWLAAIALGPTLPNSAGGGLLVHGSGSTGALSKPLCGVLGGLGAAWLQRAGAAGWDVAGAAHLEEDGWRVGAHP